MKITLVNLGAENEYEVLGLTVERSNQLQSQASEIWAKEESTAVGLQKVSEICDNLNELVFCTYCLGWEEGSNDALHGLESFFRKRGDKVN